MMVMLSSTMNIIYMQPHFAIVHMNIAVLECMRIIILSVAFWMLIIQTAVSLLYIFNKCRKYNTASISVCV